MYLTPAQIKGRIKNVAKQNGSDPITLLRIYMMERFLERITYSKYKDDKVRVVNISLDIDKESWRNRIKNDSLEWTQLIQPEEWNASSTRNLGISRIPYTMILDKTGRLEKVGLEGDELKKYIDKMVSRIDSLESVKEKG